MRGPTSWCGLLVASLTLAGCSLPVGGAAGADQAALQRVRAEQGTPLASWQALGEVTTLDYCSLLDVAGITGAAGTPVLSSFDDCSVPVAVDGVRVDVRAGFLGPAGAGNPPLRDKRLPRGLVAEREVGTVGGGCGYHLRFPDSVSLRFEANSFTTAGGTLPVSSLCPLAERAVDGAVAAVTERRVRHQSFPARSLGAVDACTLLGEGRVVAELGLPAPMKSYPGAHHCRWGEAGKASASLSFYIDKPLGSSAETLGGRASQVQPAGPDYCSVQAPHIAAAGGIEIASLFVSTRDAGKDPCAVARTLAAEAWAKLPAA
jgi:hypothetical protein